MDGLAWEGYSRCILNRGEGGKNVFKTLDLGFDANLLEMDD